MTLPKDLILSDLLHHRVRCDKGIDHGPGVMAWMHPPVHRLLGWVTRPSLLHLEKHIWRLDQLRGIGNQEAFVKGKPALSDQATLDRIPTLLEADLLNKKGQRVGEVADLVFDSKTGKIQYYLISRSDPRIPGTSRWRLPLHRIIDQQPGMVSTDLDSLDDIPLAKSSFRQVFLKRSRTWKDQINEFTDRATDRLEGWLEEPPWEDSSDESSRVVDSSYVDPLDDWGDDSRKDNFTNQLDLNKKISKGSKGYNISLDEEEDPWV